MPILAVILGFILLIAAVAVLNWHLEKRRTELLAALAARLGLSFSAARDANTSGRFAFLNRLAQGSNRYAHNIMWGSFQGETILGFDYHYETHSHSSKGGRQTHHHRLTVLTAHLAAELPELLIARESLFSKIAQTFGYDDIDFDRYPEFSRAFCVRSADPAFAEQVCNEKMTAYLLANRDLSIEIDRDTLAIVFDSRLKPDAIEPNLLRLVEVRRRLPV